MKLQFLGRKIKACASCKSKAKLEPRLTIELITPFGIKSFRINKVYEFTDISMFEYLKKMTYKVQGQTFYYFREVQ